MDMQERAGTHTWDGDHCTVCDVSIHSHASYYVCDPDRKAKALAVLNRDA